MTAGRTPFPDAPPEQLNNELVLYESVPITLTSVPDP
jgi:hypothetical protein